MNLDSGLGGIVENKKNIFIIQDTLTLGRLTGVKHANGRDWWIMIHRYYSDEYYKLLVTPDKIYGPIPKISAQLLFQATQMVKLLSHQMVLSLP